MKEITVRLYLSRQYGHGESWPTFGIEIPKEFWKEGHEGYVLKPEIEELFTNKLISCKLIYPEN